MIWAITQPKLLSSAVRNAILDESNELFASVASIWEITLKAQIGKLDLPAPSDLIPQHLRSLGITHFLPVSLAHVLQAGRLPFIHKDPFDRILIAQAITEGLILVSKDEAFAGYPVQVRWRNL